MASGWERRREEIERVTLPVSEWMVQALDPQPGDTVLELAAGPGGTGFAAAAILGEQGRLISSDFSSEMVEVARRRAAELGLANVEHRVIDAEEIALEDDSVDGVLCRFGFMLMPDPDSGARRDAPRPSPGWTSGARRLEHRRRQPVGRDRRPDPRRARPVTAAGAGRARDVRARGRGAPARSSCKVPASTSSASSGCRCSSSSTTWTTTSSRTTDLGGMFSRIWGDASDEDREAIEARLAEDFEPFAVDGGYELPGVAVVAAAS